MKKFSSYTWFLFYVICCRGIFIYYATLYSRWIKVPIAILANWLAGTKLNHLFTGLHSSYLSLERLVLS